MDDRLQETIRNTVLQMLESSSSDSNIRRMTRKHESKVHFVPIRFRIFGGVLQGLNIKFGNFIETLMRNIVDIDSGVSVMKDSGKKIKLFFTPETDTLIDSYITERQYPNSPDDCTPYFDSLLNEILEIENSTSNEQKQGLVKDIDGIFKTSGGLMVYTELKYNDDHDTGKFADINRKFIKTWIGLAVRLEIQSVDELLPIIYYFNPTKRYGPIHTPSRNIMRGSQLFDAFLETKYTDVDRFLSEISDDPEVLEIFDNLYYRIRHKPLA